LAQFCSLPSRASSLAAGIELLVRTCHSWDYLNLRVPHGPAAFRFSRFAAEGEEGRNIRALRPAIG
jgi:hypothetical protein